MGPITMFIVAFVVISITHWVYRWRNPICNGQLPPGSMGLPLLGETLQFLAPNTSSDIPQFIKQRVKRYGPIFRTSLVMRPVIVSTDPDLSHFIFQQEGKLFKSWYPDTFTEIFGRQNVGSLHGFMYKYLKNMVLNLFGPESLKKMLPEVEQAACRNLMRWSSQDSVDLKDAIASMIFDLTAKKLISYDSEKSPENLRENFVAFMKGLISFPLNIPGTAYHKCLQGRKKAMRMLKNLLQERRAKPREQQSDFFDYVLEELGREETILTEEIALDLMFVLLFASFETTSLALAMATKFLLDYPLVLKELTEEHEAILRRRENPNSGLTWKEYKSMTFTFQFINETVRLANIVPAIFRKALREIKYQEFDQQSKHQLMTVAYASESFNLSPEFSYLIRNNGKQGMEMNGASKNFMAFWRWHEILCWNRFHQSANGRLSPLLGNKVQTSLQRYNSLFCVCDGQHGHPPFINVNLLHDTIALDSSTLELVFMNMVEIIMIISIPSWMMLHVLIMSTSSLPLGIKLVVPLFLLVVFLEMDSGSFSIKFMFPHMTTFLFVSPKMIFPPVMKRIKEPLLMEKPEQHNHCNSKIHY
ncbi:cytochrome P450, family 87, subfamily A, polypeptide 2 [Actinidia rufa]|uniref:Cytochrome P450, family 87, subfamily A, polypeptide 2 n=1 Tax=Actinidia rufa TaxID=165716 RepID=A0A7J0DFA9_9ERIC|nr:cytochrome P450, family 87, subfamily A, polypeptide 2 [Actinidia rufa]